MKITLPKFSLELPLKYRSILGIIPLFAVEVFKHQNSNYIIKYLKEKSEDLIEELVEELPKKQPNGKDIKYRDRKQSYSYLTGQEESVYISEDSNEEAKIFLSIVNKRKLQNILEKVFNDQELKFLGYC